VALRLAREGADLTLAARSAESLTRSADSIRTQTGRSVDWVAADLTTPAGRAAVVAARPDADILVTHSGVPQRFADFNSLERADWLWWLDAHFFSALELIQAYVPGMSRRRFGRVVNISANFIKFPQVSAGHSHAARLALAGAIAALVREVVKHNVTINSILPGLIDTDALRRALRERAEKRKVPYETIVAEVVKGCPAGRIADPAEVADLVAMLASAQMGFVTGQNIVNDGGAYAGLF
jgi:3-oxoacyl-[acyl-carrier protein] reductase